MRKIIGLFAVVVGLVLAPNGKEAGAQFQPQPFVYYVRLEVEDPLYAFAYPAVHVLRAWGTNTLTLLPHTDNRYQEFYTRDEANQLLATLSEKQYDPFTFTRRKVCLYRVQ